MERNKCIMNMWTKTNKTIVYQGKPALMQASRQIYGLRSVPPWSTPAPRGTGPHQSAREHTVVSFQVCDLKIQRSYTQLRDSCSGTHLHNTA